MTAIVAQPASGLPDGSTATWLALSLVLATATVIAVAIGRRSTLRAGPDADAGGLGPYQVAYLHDGTRLAVLAALGALHVSALVQVRDHRVQARSADRDVDGAPHDPLEEAILEAAGTPINGTDLMAAGPVEGALNDLRDGLCRRGLLLRGGQRAAIRRRAAWPMIMLVLGIAGLIPAGMTGASVGYPVMMLVGLAVAAWWWRRRSVPFRSVAGDEILTRCRADYTSHPRRRSDWAAAGPAAAATEVGLFGIGELWRADPDFADQVLQTGDPAGKGFADTGFWFGPTHGGDIVHLPDRTPMSFGRSSG